MNNVDIVELYARETGGTGFSANFNSSSPVAPKNAVFCKIVSDAEVLVPGKALDYDTVIVVSEIAVAKQCVCTVGKIASVGIVSPHTNELYVVSSASADAMRWIFVGVIPFIVLVVAFVIFFRRRNK